MSTCNFECFDRSIIPRIGWRLRRYLARSTILSLFVEKESSDARDSWGFQKKRKGRARGNYVESEVRDWPCWCCSKRRKGRDGGMPSWPFFFLPAGSRDDGVCPRGRSILREPWIACESAAGEDREREEERERGKPERGNDRKRARVGSLSRSPWGPAHYAHLKRGRNGRGAPGVFLTRIPDIRTCQPPSHPSARSPVATIPAPLLPAIIRLMSILSRLGLFFASSSSLSRAYLARSCCAR